MNIEKDRVVSFHYRLSDEDGNALESSHEGSPMQYLHGHDGIIQGLEREMAGKAAGATFQVTVPPELGYGVRRESARQRISMKAVMTRGKLRSGMLIQVSTDHGPRQVRVIKPGKFMIEVDTNHPFAGQTLCFDVEVVDVREASAEEIAHGHVHGPHGHGH